jgi:hypothetical protein
MTSFSCWRRGATEPAPILTRQAGGEETTLTAMADMLEIGSDKYARRVTDRRAFCILAAFSPVSAGCALAGQIRGAAIG